MCIIINVNFLRKKRGGKALFLVGLCVFNNMARWEIEKVGGQCCRCQSAFVECAEERIMR
jgi:hypothetical protein